MKLFIQVSKFEYMVQNIVKKSKKQGSFLFFIWVVAFGFGVFWWWGAAVQLLGVFIWAFLSYVILRIPFSMLFHHSI